MARKKTFDVNTVDFADPRQIHGYKEYLIVQSHKFAVNGESKKVTAMKNQMELVLSAEKNLNVLRAERINDIEEVLGDFEKEISNLTAENAKLKSQLSQTQSRDTAVLTEVDEWKPIPDELKPEKDVGDLF